jgi:hypothetical protein
LGLVLAVPVLVVELWLAVLLLVYGVRAGGGGWEIE